MLVSFSLLWCISVICVSHKWVMSPVCHLCQPQMGHVTCLSSVSATNGSCHLSVICVSHKWVVSPVCHLCWPQISPCHCITCLPSTLATHLSCHCYTVMSLCHLHCHVIVSPTLSCHCVTYTVMSLCHLHCHVIVSPTLSCHCVTYTVMSLCHLHCHVIVSPIGHLRYPSISMLCQCVTCLVSVNRKPVMLSVLLTNLPCHLSSMSNTKLPCHLSVCLSVSCASACPTNWQVPSSTTLTWRRTCSCRPTCHACSCQPNYSQTRRTSLTRYSRSSLVYSSLSLLQQVRFNYHNR
jgi:hypothetical protein